MTKNPLVSIDGILGALPYFIFAPWFWQISPVGTVIGLAFGEFHVIWRHVSSLKWQTPKSVEFICNLFFITTPERHWQHHLNAFAAFGDIFTFFVGVASPLENPPAQKWLTFLRFIRRKFKQRNSVAAT